MSRTHTESMMLLIGLVVLLVLAFGGFIFQWSTVDTITVNVTKSERVMSGCGDTTKSEYFVFTENEVFKNVDSWAFLKFNSSDIYNELKAGKTYNLKVYGWRWRFGSWYRNIITCEQK